MSAEPSGNDWPLRYEISRLGTQNAHLQARERELMVRVDSLTTHRRRQLERTMAMQSLIRSAVGIPDSSRALSLDHSGRLLARIAAELTALRERVGPAEAQLKEASRAAAEAQRERTAAQKRAEVAERHAAEAEAAAALSERRRAAAEAQRTATAATLEALRKSIRAERRSIAGREGAVGQLVRAAEHAAEERVAQAAAANAEAQEEAQEEARQQAVWAAAQIAALRDELAAAKAGGEAAKAKAELGRAQREAAQQVTAAQEEARQAREALRVAQQRQREAKAEAATPAKAAPGPLLALLDRGPASITRHRARLRPWAEAGAGPALDAARSLAAALAADQVAGEARMRALTGLAGLLGGV